MLVFDNMSLSMLLVEAGVIYGVTWTLWRLFKRLVMPSPLDNIPGPPRKSFIKGSYQVSLLTTDDSQSCNRHIILKIQGIWDRFSIDMVGVSSAKLAKNTGPL